MPGRPISRRDCVKIGAIGLGGLTLPSLLRANSVNTLAPKAKSVIVLFLSGGPSQLDMWDMKPDAPEEIRGTFKPIATNVPGIHVCEHLPRMARLADKYAIVRSVTHEQSAHPAAAYWMMSGSPIARPAPDASFMSRVDRPHMGSSLAKILGPVVPSMPPFVMVPEAMAPNGPERAGQHAGFLGASFDPYRINSDPNLPDFTPGVLVPPSGLTSQRLHDRRLLLDQLDGPDNDSSMDEFQDRAFDLLSSTAAQHAFDIRSESDAVRNRYGRHVFGQSTLLARRMVEAGVRLVHVNWVRQDDLMPPTDAAFSSLIEDLDQRGILDETLVVMMGEFGRTPRFNDAGGRDHWPHCFSMVMAGGGIKGGQTYGASDRIGAYPSLDAVGPEDLIATIYDRLGVNPHALIHDHLDRPFPLADGEVISGLI
jgi:hypothetical protein